MSQEKVREKALQSIGQLPPFSPVLTKLMASLAKDDVTLSELADWIERDTVLTGNVLRMVNSAAYGRAGTISSVRHGIAILGTAKLRNIVLGLSVCKMMSNVKPPAGWSNSRFNQHAIAVAILCDQLAQFLHIDYSEGAFTAGLLHDVGKLLLAISLPEEVSQIQNMHLSTGKPIFEYERELFGLTHCELSRVVLERWQVPAQVQIATLHHHTPELDAAPPPGTMALSRTVQISDAVANTLHISICMAEGEPGDPLPALEAAGLGDKCERVIENFRLEYDAVKSLF